MVTANFIIRSYYRKLYQLHNALKYTIATNSHVYVYMRITARCIIDNVMTDCLLKIQYYSANVLKILHIRTVYTTRTHISS